MAIDGRHDRNPASLIASATGFVAIQAIYIFLLLRYPQKKGTSVVIATSLVVGLAVGAWIFHLIVASSAPNIEAGIATKVIETRKNITSVYYMTPAQRDIRSWLTNAALVAALLWMLFLLSTVFVWWGQEFIAWRRKRRDD